MIKGTIYLSLASFVFMLSGYVINVWLGRRLGPELYGFYGIVISLMTVANIIQTAGLPQSVSKYIAENQKRADDILRKSFHLQVIVTCILVVFFLLLSYPISFLLNDLRLVPYMAMAAFIFPISGIFALYIGYYNGLHLFGRQALMSIAYSLAKIVLVVVFTVFFGLYGVIIGFILSPLVGLIFGVRKLKNTRLPLRVDLLRFSIPLIGFAIVSTLHLSVDLFFTKAFSANNEVAGYYTAAQNIARIPYYGFLAFAFVLFPKISSQVGSKLIGEARTTINRATRYIIILLIPVVVFLVAAAKPLVEVLYSERYGPASVPMEILTVGYGFLLIFTIFANILSGLGRPYLSLKLSMIGLATTTVVCSLSVPKFGMVGAAFGFVVGSLLSLVLIYYWVNKIIGVKFPLITTCKVGLASTFVLAVGIMADNLGTLIGMFLIAFLGYVMLLFIFKELTKNDISLFKQLIFVKNSESR